MKYAVVTCVLLGSLAVINCHLDVKDYLSKYGYLPSDKSESSYTERDVTAAIKKFQKTFGLEESGVTDDDTLKLMNTPRCGVKDHGGEHGGVAYDYGWSKTNLSYYFYNYTPDMPQATVIERTARALQFWSDVTPLRFTRQNVDGDIVVAFGSHYHADGRRECRFPFDGPSGVLAHAFFPPDGRIHFDEDEYFTTKSQQGINYLWVSTHELGHILGLRHDTQNRDAVMFPYYRPYDPKGMHLHPNDIRRIRYLYPGKVPATVPPPTAHTKTPEVTKKGTGATQTTPICTDELHGSQCPDHKSYCKGVSDSWTDYMRKYCAKTCGYCHGGGTGPCPPECKDKNRACPGFKKRCKGYAENWTIYMRKYCRRTCRYCCLPSL